MSAAGWSACACSSQNPRHFRGAALAQIAPIANCGTSRTADCPRLGLAFVRRRLSLAFRAGFGAEGSARGDVDAVVPVVPADAIARRGVAAQHFLNDTSAGSAAGRLRLRYDALPDLEGHAQFRSLLLTLAARSRGRP